MLPLGKMTERYFKQHVRERETTLYTPVKVRTDVCPDEWGNFHMGAVCADHNGGVLDVSIAQLGSGFTVSEAEVEAMVRVLGSLAGSEIEHLKAYVDNSGAVEHITDDGVLDEFEMATIEHQGREHNTLADILADKSRKTYEQ
jgi:ribonuclease HI